MKLLRALLLGYYAAIVVLTVLALSWPGTMWSVFIVPATWPTIKLREVIAGNLPTWMNVTWFLCSAAANGFLWYCLARGALLGYNKLKGRATRSGT